MLSLKYTWLRTAWSIIFSIAAFSATTFKHVQASETQTGSGFYVSKQGHILTNHHVIDGCGRTEVELGGIRRNVKVIASDASNDISLLLDATPPTTVAVFRDGKMIRAGSDVIILGYPLYGALSHEAIVTTGTISALAGIMNNTATFQLSAPTQPGNSGGPVLDASGNIVGMMFGMLDSIKGTKMSGQVPQNVNFAIHAAMVRTFLDAHNVSYISRPPGAVRDRADVVEDARRYTVLVRCYAEEKGPTKEFVDEILVKVFDHEAPGWREIVISDYKAWVKSQPKAYVEALEKSEDPYIFAASLKDFMRSHGSNHAYPPILPGRTKTSRAASESDLASHPNPEPQDKLSQPSSQNDAKNRSVAEDLSNGLDGRSEKLKKMSPVNSPEDTTFAKPEVAMAIPNVKARVPGGAGTNQYLSTVQARIRSMWRAPVLSGKSLIAIVKFRIERDGRITNVMIEQSSGNQ